MSAWIQDLRHGVRLLWRAPGFAIVAIATLAIGIGANTAIFSIVNTLLIQDLPYRDPESLAAIWEHNIPRDRRNNVVSPGNFIHWREMQTSFEDIAAVSGTIGSTFKITLTGGGEPEEVPVQLVSAAFFPLLGVEPALGRTFTADEDKPNSRVAVLSDRLWQRRYRRDPAILGQAITINGNAYSVVGTMPEGFGYRDKSVELWIPIGLPAEARTPRGRWLSVVGRLRPGVSFERAQQDMTRVHAELTRLFPDFNTGWTARVVPLEEELTGSVRPALLLMLGAVGLVLLIACANVANLLLARATSRQRELAVRAALGAGRPRLVRQMMAESLVLAIAGGVAGLLLAWWTLGLVRGVVAERLPIPRLETVAVDGWVLAFTLALALASGIVFGLVPALVTSTANLTNALKQGGRTGSSGRGGRVRHGLAIAETAVALVLLAGAGLLLRSFVQILNVNPGFDSSRTLTMGLGLPGTRYPEGQQRTAFYHRVLDEIGRLPGVEGAGAVSFLPLTGLGAATSYEVVGQAAPALGEEPVADVRVIARDYFRAMGIPLIRGRLFNEDDEGDRTNRVIINETMARRHWPGEDPIGRRIRISWVDNREDEIVGVVGDVRHVGLDDEPRAMTYWPHGRFAYPGMVVTIRTARNPGTTASAAAGIIRQIDPELAIAQVRTMDEVVSESVAERRITMLALAVFAGAALLLAAVGIYGVIAYSVSQRIQEIGIRMALGAERRSVLLMVVRQAVVLSAAGIAIGTAGALLLTRLMKNLLFQVTTGDPLTFAAVAAVLGLVAIAASVVPGMRATRVDPVVALRAE